MEVNPSHMDCYTWTGIYGWLQCWPFICSYPWHWSDSWAMVRFGQFHWCFWVTTANATGGAPYCIFKIMSTRAKLWGKNKQCFLRSNLFNFKSHFSVPFLFKCMANTWYISVDMQLFFIAPFIILCIHRYNKKALAGLLLLIFGCVGLTLVVHLKYNLTTLYVNADYTTSSLSNDLTKIS